MLEFSELIHAIQRSVASASDAVAQKHHENLLQYFEPPPSTDDLTTALEDARRDLGDAPDDETKRSVAERLLERLHGHAHDGSSSSVPLHPKRVAIEYPDIGPDGPRSHTVHVPLIALAPISGIRLSKVRFTLNMHLHEDRDGRLLVDLAEAKGPPSNDAVPPGPGDTSPAWVAEPQSGRRSDRWSGATTVHIELEGGTPPDGVKKLIEGYERALRAQIPG